MKVVILGAGRVGYNIARYLATEENNVTIVDESSELLQRISDTMDVQPVLGYASHPDVLDRAGVSDADLLIALVVMIGLRGFRSAAIGAPRWPAFSGATTQSPAFREASP